MKKTKIKLRTQFTDDRYKGEDCGTELMTVPDEAYTIQDILDKFTRGVNLNISKNGVYTDTDDFDDVDELSTLNDLTDFEEIEASMAARRSRRDAKAKQAEPKTAKPVEPSTAQPDLT